MILALKTANETSEIYLISSAPAISAELIIIKEEKWQAGRELGRTLLGKIEQFLSEKSFNKITGLIVFSGPGSFTGLRIGITTMNTIAYSENIPIVGVSGETWLKNGTKRLKNNENDKIVIPDYGAEPNITVKSTNHAFNTGTV